MKSKVTYGKGHSANELAKMTPEQIDRLPFGIIQIDKTGTIHGYNETESRYAGRDVTDVIGKNFFRDIAPCSCHPSFLGRFLKLRNGEADSTAFTYVFDYGFRAKKVDIEIRRERDKSLYWLIIKWGDHAESNEIDLIRPKVAKEISSGLLQQLVAAEGQYHYL